MKPFGQNVICGDAPDLKRGKPHPDPFLLAGKLFLGLEIEPDPQGLYHRLDSNQVKQLQGIRPDEILVFEDGLPGVRAAKAAGMHVVWVPDPELKSLQQATSGDPHGADEVLDSLQDWNGKKWGLPNLPR